MVRKINEHICPQNNTKNEVWPEIKFFDGDNGTCDNGTWFPTLTLVGATPTGRFEHSERITFCPYCGADLRIGTGCGIDLSGEGE